MFTLIAMNLQRAFKKDELLISSTTSMWTAHVVKQANKIPQRFEQTEPPLVLWATIGDGPKVSTSADVNSGPGVSLSSGKLTGNWPSEPFTVMEISSIFAPTIQKLPFQTAVSVNNLP